MILLDTSGLVVAYSSNDQRQARVIDVLTKEAGALVLSPFVLAELDYLLESRAGVHEELKVLSDVAEGVYRLAEFSCDDVAQAAAIVEQYRDLRIGLADASIVVLAARYGTNRVLTFDERHFRAIRPPGSTAFELLPADGAVD